MTKLRLSHSSVSSYQLCGKKYYYHYIEKWRDKETSAALLFGTALDKTIESILKDIKQKSYDDTLQTYFNIFTNQWRNGYINKSYESLWENERLVYAASDFDSDLLQSKDLLFLFSRLDSEYKELGIYTDPNQVLDIFYSLRKKKETSGWDNMTIPEKRFYNLVNWSCLYKKGLLMIEAFRRDIKPKIKEVIDIQREISLENEEGDSVIGFIDAILKLDDDSIVIIDFKTSARDYAYDSVIKSPQLSLYLHAVENEYNTRKAGFIVFKKGINKQRSKICSKCSFNGTGSKAKTCTNEIGGKRCGGEWDEKINPIAETQVIVSDIPKYFENIVIENFMEVNAAIKAEVFPRNFSACESPFPCPYIKLCHKGIVDGLEKEEK